MDFKEEILKGREERAKLINDYLKDYSVIISITANMPGGDKNIYLSYLLINAFSFLVNETANSDYFYSFNQDGPFLLIFKKNGNSDKLKKQMILIEENHELGRFIDIDVYDKYNLYFRENKRKCMLCNDLAIRCMRNKKHKEEELISHIEKNVFDFYSKKFEELIDFSIMGELNLHPKFGLVTPFSSGSHKDMNYDLMIKAKEAIIPYYIKILRQTLITTNLDKDINHLKDIGIQAEKAMLQVTGDINAYKGLIYNLGLLISAYGYKISRYEVRSVYEISKQIANRLHGDYNYESNSYGDQAYRNYKIRGVRGEALSGFVNVQKAIHLLKDFSQENLLITLIYYIINIEDTSFLKRSVSYNKYQDIKRKFKELNIKNKAELEKLNKFCLDNNLSFGGSADLLVLSIFIKKINHYLVDLKEKKY